MKQKTTSSGLGMRLKTKSQKQKKKFKILPIPLAQVQACNASETLLNEIPQINFFLYKAKKISKKVYSKTMNSMKMVTIQYVYEFWK